jgi:hypothetical protein
MQSVHFQWRASGAQRVSINPDADFAVNGVPCTHPPGVRNVH